MKKLIVVQSILYPGLIYDERKGTIHRRNSEGNICRRLLPNDEQIISYYDVYLKRQIKRKAIRLIYEIKHNRKLRPDEHLYFKDLDDTNLKYTNIGVLDNSQFMEFNDAYRNINGSLCLVNSSTEPYVVTLKYYKRNELKSVKYHDIVIALREKQLILHRSLKILNKYVVSV